MTGFVCIENPPLDKALTKEWISVTEYRGQTFERRKSEREGVGDTGSLVWSYI